MSPHRYYRVRTEWSAEDIGWCLCICSRQEIRAVDQLCTQFRKSLQDRARPRWTLGDIEARVCVTSARLCEALQVSSGHRKNVALDNTDIRQYDTQNRIRHYFMLQLSRFETAYHLPQCVQTFKQSINNWDRKAHPPPLSLFFSLDPTLSDLGNLPQRGWEHIPDYVSYHPSNSSAGGSSDVLSPSLQSYLHANDPSWAGGAGGGGGSSGMPQQRRDPSAIYRAEIARMGRRFGFNSRPSGGKGFQSGTKVGRRSARAAGSAHRAAYVGSSSTGSYHSTSPIRDGRYIKNEVSKRKWRGAIPQRSYRVEGVLEQGWDGRVTLTGKPSWRESGTPRRSVESALHSAENSRYSLHVLVCISYGKMKHALIVTVLSWSNEMHPASKMIPFHIYV